jgi:Ca2+-binding EF-hand superfamily protein
VPHHLRFAIAASLLASGSAAFSQAAPKPVGRADYVKSLDTRFAATDLNHDGSIGRDEMVAAQQRDLQQAKAKIAQQLQVKFRQLDTNKDGSLSVQEFLAAAPAIRTSETPEQMIQKFDSNHDGKISSDEFKAPELTLFNKADANHDGIVTPAEAQAASKR